MKNKETEKVIERIIKLDGGKNVKANIFDSVLIIKACAGSAHQVKRFKRTGLDIGMFKRAKVEVLNGMVTLSALIKA